MIRRPFGSIDPYSIRETELHTDSRRSPFGSIDPNSIRETELHTDSRRRHSRGERESLHSPQLDRERDAARQRAAATRRREPRERGERARLL